MTSPFVVIHQYADDALAAFVHLEGKVRSIFGTNAADIERRLVNTHIAEFGFNQQDAEAAAKAAVAPLNEPAPAPPVDLRPMVDDLDRQLTAMLQRALKAEADARLLKSTQDDLAISKLALADSKAQIADLQAALAKATAGSPPNTPPQPGGSVPTPAEVQTPPAEASPPQTDTGAAPIPAATGGEQGTKGA